MFNTFILYSPFQRRPGKVENFILSLEKFLQSGQWKKFRKQRQRLTLILPAYALAKVATKPRISYNPMLLLT